MAKYVIDIDFVEDDCSFCPFFVQHPHDAWCVCTDDERELTEELRDASDGVNKVWCFDRPEWCPLMTVDECLIKEWMENANSQPEKDEEKTVVRLGLYKSEWDKAGALSLKYRLTMAQTIARLIEEAYGKIEEAYGNEVPH